LQKNNFSIFCAIEISGKPKIKKQQQLGFMSRLIVEIVQTATDLIAIG